MQMALDTLNPSRRGHDVSLEEAVDRLQILLYILDIRLYVTYSELDLGHLPLYPHDLRFQVFSGFLDFIPDLEENFAVISMGPAMISCLLIFGSFTAREETVTLHGHVHEFWWR